jgi:two-component system CheB/CheR fusion protein
MALKKTVPRKTTAGKVKRATAAELKPSTTALRAKAARAKSQSFPIVGIGASAGGLEAFTQLLGALPLDTGLAFVLVQHLDPKHESMLTALLARATPLPIHEARDGMRIEANHIYVIPSNANLAVLHGRLSLMPRTEARGQHLSVDFFFRSLAADQKSRAIGVILSGTASDGTEGLRAIKAEGGLTFAQDEKSAKYDGMPHSAIAAGVVDFVLPPEGIARELARLGRESYIARPAAAKAGDALPEGDEDLNKVFILLRSATGVDFSFYKPTTLKRRIARRMMLHKIESLATYVRFLKHTPNEVDALYQDLLINVTSFFREPEVFEALKKRVFPRLLKNPPPQTPIRVWVPGCSTGEEAYSIVIALLEFLGNKSASVPVQVFATDISESAIDKARIGIYPAGIAADVSAARRRRFFVKHADGFQISKAVRDVCVFARQDLTKDPPFSKLDLISCRNLLIYFGPILQKRVIPTFHYALKPDGLLLLGDSETIGGFADLFALADSRHKLYTRKQAAHRMEFALPHHGQPEEEAKPGQTAAPASAAGFDYQKEADRIVLGKYTPPGVVVNEHLDILQFRGYIGAYLEPAPGAASLNILKMAREGLLLDLRGAINDAKRRNGPARRPGVQVKSNGGFHEVNVEVIPLHPAPSSRAGCFLVLFEEAAPADLRGVGAEPEAAPVPPGTKARSAKSAKLPLVLPRGVAPISASRRVALTPRGEHDKLLTQLRQELTATTEYLQSVIAEHERTNEELQSANEEILSSNEERQSTNEEMETAREELQSTNEELTTVNDELHTRNTELGQVNGDLVNLLNSVQIPIVMLGGELRIRRFTPLAEQVLNLIPTDVGRPLSNLRPNIIVPEFERLITEVMDSLTPKEVEVQDIEGCWYSLRIRPYKTLENKIDGVILALVDIDTVRRALAQAREAREFADAIVETVRHPLLVLDGDLRVKTANQAFYKLFHVRPAETENRFVYNLGKAQWDIAKLRELLERILPKNSRFENFEVDAEFPGVGRKKLVLNARRIADERLKTKSILLAIEEAKSP